MLEFAQSRQEPKGPGYAGDVNVCTRRVDVPLLLGVLPFVHDMTERTRMRAIERSFYGFAKGNLLDVIDHHRSPGD